MENEIKRLEERYNFLKDCFELEKCRVVIAESKLAEETERCAKIADMEGGRIDYDCGPERADACAEIAEEIRKPHN